MTRQRQQSGESTLTRRHIPGLIVVLALTSLLAFEVLQQPPSAVDEPAWLTSGALTFDLARTLSPPSTWASRPGELRLGDWGNKNPPLGKLYFGTILWVTGHREPINYRWQWPHTLEENIAGGHIPPFSLLTPVRLGVVLTAAVVLWLVYCLGVQLGAGLFASIGPLFLFALPVFRFHATHVYTDLPELVCLLASGVALMTYGQSRRSGWLWLASVFAGLACAVKFNAAPAVASLVIVVLWTARTTRRRVADLAVALLVPFLIFVAVNPYLYPAPIARTRGLVDEWQASKAEQQQDPTLMTGAVHTRTEALALVMTRSIVRPTSTPPFTSGPMTEGLVLGPWILALALGIAELRRSIRDATTRVWLALLVMPTIFTIIWLPFDWARYYLPVIIWLPPLFAATIAASWRMGSSRWTDRIGHSDDRCPRTTRVLDSPHR
jgi:hypothetical protein